MKFSLLAISTFFTLTLATYKQPTKELVGLGAVRLPDYAHPVTTGRNFQIVWDADGLGTRRISLVLLNGCSKNCKRVLDIVTGIPANYQINSNGKGTYIWSVPRGLQTSGGKDSYGIQLIVDQTGEYQYSTSFAVVGGGREGRI
ncbi:hypothetical protein BZA77DRAFT_294031 [Pyronema omphalodes]|nr:hypothetical protein BZA77DRAFT_294031 [Pyronema omphalodes]